jgi:hypothetical protein
MAKYKLSLDQFEAEHAAIGKHIAAARDSVTESGGYRMQLNQVRDCHRRMGQLIADAFESMQPRGETAAPRGAADRAPGASVEIPHINRIMNKTLI